MNKVVNEDDDGGNEAIEELEGFDDFTIASSWERFISEIEAVCRQWLADGPTSLLKKGAECVVSSRNMNKVKCELKYGLKKYFVEYYFVSSEGRVTEWDEDLHDMQLLFGVDEFLIIAPLSASGVVLDSPEACKLLSAIAIALSNCGSNWPALVPVHDPSRKAHIGIQTMGTICTRRFDSDRINSQVPVKFMHLEGLYELFIAKFAFSSLDPSAYGFKVSFTMKLTYETPSLGDDTVDLENATRSNMDPGNVDSFSHVKAQWDDRCPWTEWYSAEDPVKGFELIAIWKRKMLEGSLEMAELENISTLYADKWILFPFVSASMIDDSDRKYVGFSSQLRLLVDTFEMSFLAQFLEDFISAEVIESEKLKLGIVPPPTVRDRVLKELFHDDGSSSPNLEVENRNARVIKGAPLESLFAQFCMQSLWFGNCNIRAIAALWIEFVREVRWFWEESLSLPNIPTDIDIDLSACLVHQKLQLLALCIKKKNVRDSDLYNSSGTRESSSTGIKSSQDEKNNDLGYHNTNTVVTVDSLLNEDTGSGKTSYTTFRADSKSEMVSSEVQKSTQVRKGSSGICDTMMLLHSFQKMHAPYTQDAPIMTEDMHEERLNVAEAFGDTFSISGQLEREILSSDMSAFKAANPDSIFEDFIRWHSPTDWESEGHGFTTDQMMSQTLEWPPRGRLSQRMLDHGNLWRRIWNESPPIPACEQKPLFDPVREGEKALHYLETLRPHQLLEQMICTAFRASSSILNLTSYGGFAILKTKVDQLYLTLSSGLKTLSVKHPVDTDELINDLRRLAVVFENIEKLVILAASIHFKLSEAPRLAEAVFNDYFNFYLPKMGTSLKNICFDKKFSSKQIVKMHERDVVANLFPQPTPSQSWRKVLNMGNLLNGHEPVSRELIFSASDKARKDYYVGNLYINSSEELETHRMYIRGTSNDLRVALSVTSWD